jgi:hypothetical protein
LREEEQRGKKEIVDWKGEERRGIGGRREEERERVQHWEQKGKKAWCERVEERNQKREEGGSSWGRSMRLRDRRRKTPERDWQNSRCDRAHRRHANQRYARERSG